MKLQAAGGFTASVTSSVVFKPRVWHWNRSDRWSVDLTTNRHNPCPFRQVKVTLLLHLFYAKLNFNGDDEFHVLQTKSTENRSWDNVFKWRAFSPMFVHSPKANPFSTCLGDLIIQVWSIKIWSPHSFWVIFFYGKSKLTLDTFKDCLLNWQTSCKFDRKHLT